MVVVPFEAISDRPARFAGNVLLKAKTKPGSTAEGERTASASPAKGVIARVTRTARDAASGG